VLTADWSSSSFPLDGNWPINIQTRVAPLSSTDR
jgi:hypothetical protein